MSQLQEEINGLRSAISTLKNATAFSNVLPNSKKRSNMNVVVAVMILLKENAV